MTVRYRFVCWAVLALAVPLPGRADEVATSLYIRNDSDTTLVVSPRARVRTALGESTHAELAYAIDIWTSASIDIRTAASLSVTEQRDEIDASIQHDLTDLTFTGSYRYSTENDYESHTGSGSVSYDMADNNTTLAANGYLGADTVGRAGDPGFARGLTSYGARLSLTQVIDPKTVLQGAYEFGVLDGYQASPYRFVGFGGDGYGCRGAVLCLPELLPQQRTRHALVLDGRRALSDTVSIGVGYRFYFDSWGLSSHTLQSVLAWLPDDLSKFSLTGRVYAQSAADFYQEIYAVGAEQNNALHTRDRELSKLSSYKLGADYTRSFEIGSEGILLRASVAAAVGQYSYDQFVGLRNGVRVIELTTALTVDL
jgi:hypothetical protein